METATLHLVGDDAAIRFLHMAAGDPSRLTAATRPGDFERYMADFARLLLSESPTFAGPGASLTVWESHIDRGIGMLLRPPARLFIEAGLDPALARQLPIRVVPGGGAMAGAVIPARLIPALLAHLEQHAERTARRLADAERPVVETFATLWQAALVARESGMGLLEGEGIIDPGEPRSWPPGADVRHPNPASIDPALRQRLLPPDTPAPKTGLLGRLRRR